MSKAGFYDYNRTRSFPFLENTVSLSNQVNAEAASLVELPDDAIVDCGFILGPLSGFDAAQHSVYLSRVQKVGMVIRFEFACTAPELASVTLAFTRESGSEDKYVTEYVDAISGACEEPPWSGYLVTGALSALDAILAVTAELLGQATDAVVEPSLLQNLSNTMAVTLNTANEDRTRVRPISGCDAITWQHPTGGIFTDNTCIQGEIKFRPGFNSLITQNASLNSITLGAAVGAGAGEPCSEVPLFPDEQPPDDSTNSLFSGGALCNETLRSLNGLGGPAITLLSGAGTTISADPLNHKITVDFNLVDLIQPTT